MARFYLAQKRRGKDQREGDIDRTHVGEDL